MKILAKGNGAKSWSKKVTCTGKGNDGGGCGAKLLIERTDLFHTFRSYYDGDTDTFTSFMCPECKVITDIDDARVPDGRELPSLQTWKKNRGRNGR